MTALTEDRATPERDGKRVSDPLADGALVFAGGMYALDGSGDAVAASAAGNAVRAVALQRTDASSGDERVEGALGVFRFGNSESADEITRTEIGLVCYVVDDQTVAKTDDSASRPVAGVVFDVDDAGVWVRIGA